jgi:hypothetical protein
MDCLVPRRLFVKKPSDAHMASLHEVLKDIWSWATSQIAWKRHYPNLVPRLFPPGNEVGTIHAPPKYMLNPFVFEISNIYLALPTRAGSPQQHMPITVGPFCLTHPVNFPCGRKPEHPEETHDFRQSVDFYSFHMRTGFESHWESSHWDLNLRPQRWKARALTPYV